METLTDRLVGTKLGRYQIEALLGRGRGATVYRGVDPVVNRRVAIKVLDQSVARDRRVVEAFLRDTRILATLRHPHILPIYEVGEQHGSAYFVRLLTDGGTLQARLRDGKQLPLGEAAAILRPVATALDYAHRQSIIHRNLRPTNILLAADEHVFVTDFSLPGKENQSSAATTIVHVTAAPAYVSPEQARGATLDGRSDIYVLTVILYEALVGRPPFQMENATETARTVIARHLQEAPPSPQQLNPALGQNVEAVLLRGLEKSPEKRYPTAAALFYALSEAEELDRSTRRQVATIAPARPPTVKPPPVVARIAPATPASTEADLDDLLATLTVFDTPPTESVETTAPVVPAASLAIMPPFGSPQAPEPAQKAETPPELTPPPATTSEAWPLTPKAAAPVAQPPAAMAGKPTEVATVTGPPVLETVEVAAPTRQPQAPAQTGVAAKRSPLPYIGVVVAVLVIVLMIALVAIMRGGQGAPEENAQAAPSTSVSTQVAVAPPPTVVATQPAAAPSVAVVATAVPAAAAASVAPPVAAVPASAQPAAPVRREAIVYAETQGAGKTTNLVAIGPDGKDRRQIFSLPGNAWGPHIAADGRSIVYAIGAGTTSDQTFVGGLNAKGMHDLYLVMLDGTAPTQLTATTSWNAGWSWSPDGKTLAFASDRDGNAEIYLMSFPSQQVKRLTTSPGQDAWPTWTPDGKAIVFMSTRDGYPQIYRIEADGRNATRLITSEAADSFPMISPDGSKLAYVSQGIGANDDDIFVANLDGSNATRLTNTGDNGQPVWSPDGSRLAFASKRDGNYNIYTIRVDGTGLSKITDALVDEITPSWGIVEFPAGSAGQAPLADLPLGGAILLAVMPRRRKQQDED